jgi:hypothetical protein
MFVSVEMEIDVLKRYEKVGKTVDICHSHALNGLTLCTICECTADIRGCCENCVISK